LCHAKSDLTVDYQGSKINDFTLQSLNLFTLNGSAASLFCAMCRKRV